MRNHVKAFWRGLDPDRPAPEPASPGGSEMTDDPRRHDVLEYRSCANCEERFFITVGEAAFYEARGFHLPRRCKPCRLERKERLNDRTGV